MFILADIFHNAVVIPQVVFAYYCYVFEAVFVLFLLITCDDMSRFDFGLRCQKTFQDFEFFFDENQTVTVASNPCLSNKGGNEEHK